MHLSGAFPKFEGLASRKNSGLDDNSPRLLSFLLILYFLYFYEQS